MPYSERKPLYQKLAGLRGSAVLTYVTGDRPGLETVIAEDAIRLVGDLLDNYAECKKISLVLYTRGGNTLAAWSLVNLVREFCKQLEVIVPARCYSAGTLICLGADSIAMTKQAHLGPIDPSINSPLNPHIPGKPESQRAPISVEDVAGFIDMARNEAGVKTPTLSSQIFMKLADGVHPIALGRVQRARGQIQNLARKLLSKHMTSEEKINKIIKVLCTDAGSHDYWIYRTEAREIGLNVETPTDDLYTVIRQIYSSFRADLQLDVPFNPAMVLGGAKDVDYEFTRILVESQEHGGYNWVKQGKLSVTADPKGQMQYQDVTKSEGWKEVK